MTKFDISKVFFDPDDVKVSTLIGKKVYVADSFVQLKLRFKQHFGIQTLTAIEKESLSPFRTDRMGYSFIYEVGSVTKDAWIADAKEELELQLELIKDSDEPEGSESIKRIEKLLAEVME